MDSAAPLRALLRGRRCVALIGAGCSTESGIPDYRGPETARRARNPIQYQGFVGDAETRRRYWARSLVGWERIRSARPNPAHLALAELEQRGELVGLITQNVDGLHHAAGSQNVVELHGSMAWVRCLGCGVRSERWELQERLIALNPGWVERPAEAAPDGDAEVASVVDFRVAECVRCGGPLKPDVVFFGENVPRERVDRAYAQLAEADVLLVVGSSLVVFSGYRFVKRAATEGKPIGIVNLGPSRGDSLAAVRVVGKAGEVLPTLLTP